MSKSGQLSAAGATVMSEGARLRRLGTILSVGLSILLATGCGNNQDDPQPEPVKLLTEAGSTLDSSPSAELVANDDAAADSLATELNDNLDALSQLGQVASGQGDTKASASSAHGTKSVAAAGESRAAIMASRNVVYNCTAILGPGASGTITYTFPDTAPTAGWQSNLTFNNCAYNFGTRAYSVNGALLYQYVRYVSGSDFGFVGKSQNLVLATSRNGVLERSVTYALTYAFDIHNNVIVTSYATPAAVFRDLRVRTSGASQVIVDLSAVIDMKVRRGAVRVKLTSWTYDLATGHAVGGQALITGANNTRALVVPTSTGYTITYTDSAGLTKTYTYAWKV